MLADDVFALCKKTISLTLTLFLLCVGGFFSLFFSFTANFGPVSAQHRLDSHEYILVSANNYISSKFSFDPYHPDALLSMFRSQATSLCSI